MRIKITPDLVAEWIWTAVGMPAKDEHGPSTKSDPVMAKEATRGAPGSTTRNKKLVTKGIAGM